MAKKMIVYYNGGEDYAGEFDNTSRERKAWKIWAKENNQIGFISGYRYFNNETDSVLVFCAEKPSIFDIEKRKTNGLRNAKWNYINILRLNSTF